MFKKSGKRAQAAMEFLMTYGWAILIILIALGVLFYLGVFNPQTPTNCIPNAPISSCNVLLTATGGEVSVSYPTAIANTVTFTGLTFTSGGTACSHSATLTSGTGISFTAAQCAHGLSAGDKFNGEALVTYIREGSDITQTARLTFSGTA
ncbi:hypothetical protein CL617_02085 [archaeon]|nr:hypothetical protein [archaeon]